MGDVSAEPIPIPIPTPVPTAAPAPRPRLRVWRVLRDLTLSLVLLLALLGGLELWLRTDAAFELLPMARPYYSYDVTRRLWYLEQLERDRGHVDVLFLGSSIVRAGIDPTIFDQAMAESGAPDLVSFNAGLSSMFPVGAQFYLENLWLQKARPRFVLHGVREAEMATRNRWLGAFRKGRVESQWHENTTLSMLYAELIERLRLLQYRGTLRTAIERSRAGKPWHTRRERGEITTDERGFRGERVRLDQKKRAHSKRLWVYKRPPHPKRFRYVLPSLEAMNAACKAAGAQYVLVNMPEYPERYGDKYGAEIFADYHARVRAWASANGVPFLDITDADMQSFANAADYSDYHHLSKRGARHFTTRLAARFAELLRSSAHDGDAARRSASAN